MHRFKLFLLASVLIISGCQSVPSDPPRKDTYALARAEVGPLVTLVQGLKIEEGMAAMLPLYSARDAMKWRLALIDNATESVDLQYFIWSRDAAGALLFDRLLKAADRGVRVRLLVDDIALEGKDDNIAVFSLHPNIEIRLYNPGLVRKSALGSMGEFLLNFRSLNRRMHNKMFVVDSRIAIVGGRNIGNPYFGMSDHYNNSDLDVMLLGQVVNTIADAYDRYWNAKLAYPGEAMSKNEDPEQIPQLRTEIELYLQENQERLSSFPLQVSDWQPMFDGLSDQVIMGEASFLQDIPVSQNGTELKLLDMIDLMEVAASKEVIMISPYFIPSEGMIEAIAEHAARGVEVKILTTSLGSNNHTSVHAAYRKYRRRVLEAGATLYEFRHDPSESLKQLIQSPPVQAEFISLHAKAMVTDRNQVFIGSLNLDPRAVILNSENGVYIQSEALGSEIGAYFDRLTSPENAWRVSLDEKNKIRWDSSAGTVYKQPARSTGQRISDFFLGIIPIESQL